MCLKWIRKTCELFGAKILKLDFFNHLLARIFEITLGFVWLDGIKVEIE